MTARLDHIMYAVNDLNRGIKEVTQKLGVKAAFGGSHPNAGTCNALLSFGGDQYLEIIAPDDNQVLAGTMGEELKQRPSSGIRAWAATGNFETISGEIEITGFGSRIVEMSRTRPDGVLLAWKILFVTGHPFGHQMPFFIDWLDSPHPANDAPAGCQLESVSISLPETEAFAAICASIGLAVSVVTGPPLISATIMSPNGRVTL